MAFLLILGKKYLVFSDKCSNFAVVIELERHIEILLLDNDCVIVPGLGGFTAHHIEARYDDADGVFLPPLRTLGFNPQLKINDSLLVQSYIEAYDISYPEALRRIESEVDELCQRLANDGYYEMTDRGVLEVNEDGNTIFTPCEAGILTPGLYGLSSFEMKPMVMDVAEEISPSAQKAKSATTVPLTTKVFDQPTPQQSGEEDNTDSVSEEEAEKTICIKVSWLRNAGITAAAAILLLLVFLPISHSGLQNVNIGDFNGTSFFSKLMPKDSQMNNINISDIKSGNKGAAMKDLDKDSQKKSIKEAVEDSMKYSGKNSEKDSEKDSGKAIEKVTAKTDTFCIVLASCIPQKNAERYVEQLHNKGFDKAFTMVNNKMVRVVYGNYTSESEAYSDLQKIRSNDEFEQAWILKKK